MPNRDHPLTEFIDALSAAVSVGSLHAGKPDNVSAATRRILATLATPGTVAAVQSAQLDACRHLKSALANARRGPHPIAALAEAFAPVKGGAKHCHRGRGGEGVRGGRDSAWGGGSRKRREGVARPEFPADDGVVISPRGPWSARGCGGGGSSPVHYHGRNAKLLFGARLVLDASSAGLYLHPKHRRRRLCLPIVSSKE